MESKEDVARFVKTHSQVDHVISSFLFHWLLDVEQGFRNVFDLLKPGGDFFTVHFHSVFTSDMNLHAQRSEKWGHYFTNLDRHIPKSTTENHSDEQLKRSLIDCGFVDTFVELKRSSWALNPGKFVTLIRSVHVQINNIPGERTDEYMEDYVELAKEKKFIRITAAGDYEFDFNTFTAYGRRPNEIQFKLPALQ